MMKYLILGSLLLAPVMTNAAGIDLNSNLENVGGTAYGTSSTPDALTIIGTILNTLFGLLGMVLLGYFIYAGYLWMTAQGDEEKVGKAQGIIKTAIIGLIIILASYSIANFVVDQITSATS